jgi:hypothetical protein
MAAGLSNEVDEKSKEFQQFRQSVGPEKFDAFQAICLSTRDLSQCQLPYRAKLIF